MRKTDQATYQAQRQQVIASLDAMLGKDAVVPLDTVGHLLPVVPEWEEFQTSRRARHGGGR